MATSHIAYLIDPRFPGGTSSAVAAELRVVSKFARVSVHALSTKMFKGGDAAPVLQDALDDLGLTLKWDEKVISADTVVFHNPSCLKFQTDLEATILARNLVVVTHENFVRPSGAESFDVEKCLTQLRNNAFVVDAYIAPLSEWNRTSIQLWQAEHKSLYGWEVLDFDWFNICDFEFVEPNETISDRRGRLSRPGFEKFPPSETLHACFPAHADSNVILGADILMDDPETPAHWTLLPFRGVSVGRFFEMVDFMVYYISPLWRESFGRVLAEAVAAGKIVITDRETAKPFLGAAIGADPNEVDGIIARYLANPDEYRSDVKAAQKKLDRFSPEKFQAQVQPFLERVARGAA